MSCHGPSGGKAAGVTATRVLLVGEPNVGKSTLFNTLTGARQRIVNAPGTTVELTTGRWQDGLIERELVDLPGTHSLLARSPDEQVTADAVREVAAALDDDDARDAVVVVVVDATALERSLYLVAQVAETGAPFVVALTMVDRSAGRDGVDGDALAEALAQVMGVPVAPIDPRDRDGDTLADLATAVDNAAFLGNGNRDALPPIGRPVDATLEDELAHAQTLFDWVERVSSQVRERLHADTPPVRQWPGTRVSDRIDAVLLNPWIGIPVFLLVVFALFELTTRVAAPAQQLLAWVADQGPIAAASWAVSSVGLSGTWVEGLLIDGLLAGLVTVLAFLPVMGVMFLALGVLEGSGYMARAALVADRAMRAMGLDGRALLPLIVGFGCNIPALAATRTLPKARHRMLTGLLVPLTTCSARLTVYVLLASIFFPGSAALVIFCMYLASVVLVIAVGLVLKHTAFRDLRAEPLMLALPDYQWPHLRTLLVSAWVRVRAFVVGAGTIIVGTMLCIWVLTTIPAPGYATTGPNADNSVYGAVADAVSPVFAPAGFADRTATSALMAGFVAKEVVVGSFAQSTAIDTGDGNTEKLGPALRQTFDESSGGHGAAAALAFMVFVLAYTPCVAALAEQRRLFGWRPTLTAVAFQLVGAWVLAVIVFQIGSSL